MDMTIIHDTKTHATIFSDTARPGRNNTAIIIEAMARHYGCTAEQVQFEDHFITIRGERAAYFQ